MSDFYDLSCEYGQCESCVLKEEIERSVLAGHFKKNKSTLDAKVDRRNILETWTWVFIMNETQCHAITRTDSRTMESPPLGRMISR